MKNLQSKTQHILGIIAANLLAVIAVVMAISLCFVDCKTSRLIVVNIPVLVSLALYGYCLFRLYSVWTAEKKSSLKKVLGILLITFISPVFWLAVNTLYEITVLGNA